MKSKRLDSGSTLDMSCHQINQWFVSHAEAVIFSLTAGPWERRAGRRSLGFSSRIGGIRDSNCD